MNNNIPNNLNNDPMGNNNQVPNPGMAQANEQLMGGQSQVGPENNIMQGMAGVPNTPTPMQGMENPVVTPGIMQGAPMEQAPVEPQMPGQGNSGINGLTMQMEPQAPVAPEPVMPQANTPEPAMPEAPVVENTMSAPIDNNPIDGAIPNVMANFANSVPAAPLDQTNQIPNVGIEPQAPVAPEPVMPQAPVEPVIPEAPAADGLNNPMVSPIMGAPAPEMNQAPNNMNVIGNPEPVNAMPEQPVQQDIPVQNTIGAEPQASIEPAANTIGNPQPQEAQPVAENGEFEEMPQKKFPLSKRETILVSIALIGIIAVIIVYWPR